MERTIPKGRCMQHQVKNKNLALILLAGAQFMVVLDATIVNVALPSIQKALHFTNAASLQWIVTAYTLLFGGFLLLGGRMADIFGRRKIFLFGILLFSIASLVGGLSQNSAMIIIFRSLQGLGAAFLSPAALSLVLSIFKEGPDRNRALGVWSAVAAGGGAVGLLLGGILTQYVSWRWIFFINVPVGMVIAFFTLRAIPEISANLANRKVDLLGAITVTGGLMSLVYALVKAPSYGWLSANTLGVLGLAIALLVAFVVNESLVKHPLVRLSIFKIRNVWAGNLMQLPITAGLFGLFFYISIYLQQILHYSPTKAGLANLPFTLFLGVSAAIVSKNIAKISPKTILIGSPLVVAAGLFFFSRIPVHGEYWQDIFPGIALMATGMGMTFVALTLAATGGVSHKDSGLVSGLLNTSQQIGGALGLAVLSALSTARTVKNIAAGQPNITALVGGFRYAFVVGGFLLLGASVIALFGLKGGKLSDHQLAEEEEIEGETFPVVPGV
jgi:EmrB/QacA subfamily drug resistance transporter